MKLFAAALAIASINALTVDPNCTISLSDGSAITVYYDANATEQIIMEASIVAGSFAGFGWGASMHNTEMVIFSANGDASALQTYYGIGTTKPQADPALSACYTTTITQANGMVNFTASRPLDCGI